MAKKAACWMTFIIKQLFYVLHFIEISHTIENYENMGMTFLCNINPSTLAFFSYRRFSQEMC